MRQMVLFITMVATFAAFAARAADTYLPVPVTISNSVDVPGHLEKLLVELRLAAGKNDLDAVLSHVSSDFFWDGDHGGGYDAMKTAQDNFSSALSLDPKRVKPEHRADLWLAFNALVDARTASAHPGKQGVICLPGKGKLANETDAEKTADGFGVDPWYGMVFAVGRPVAVREAPKSASPIVGKIHNEAVIVRLKLKSDPDATWEPVQLSDGVAGWVPSQQVQTFLDAQLCFAKGSNETWKIVGYNGGGD